MLWPAKPTPNIRIALPEEFAAFADDRTSFYLIQWRDLSTLQALPMSGSTPMKPRSVTATKRSVTAVAKPPRTLPRKLERWMKRKCPDLLHEIGKPANLEPFTIDTGDTQPINIRPRSYSPVDLEKIKAFINENLKNGVISESESPWSFPLVIAQKPNGGTRVCVDYRALNQITRKDAHAIPRIDESLLRFFGMRFFSESAQLRQ